jgi:hypothetical protein
MSFASRLITRTRSSLHSHIPPPTTFARSLASIAPNQPTSSSPSTSQPQKQTQIPSSERLKGAVGEHAGENLKREGGGVEEMFGFEVTKKESAVGGREKTDGRPIYLDAQVSWKNRQRFQFDTFRSTDHLGILFAFRFPLSRHRQATTPMDPRVLDTILPYLTDLYGNPHSRTHAYGWEAETAVEKARSVSSCSLPHGTDRSLTSHTLRHHCSKSRTSSEPAARISSSPAERRNPTTC